MVLGWSSGLCESCWVGFVVGAWQKSVVICPITSEPNSYQMTSTEPINSMHIISTIIFWHVQMVIINGFGVVIWPMWVMLGQICGQGVTKVRIIINSTSLCGYCFSDFGCLFWYLVDRQTRYLFLNRFDTNTNKHHVDQYVSRARAQDIPVPQKAYIHIHIHKISINTKSSSSFNIILICRDMCVPLVN
jgi:hypothetical protein